MEDSTDRRPYGALLLTVLALVLAFGGGYLADSVRTNFGTVSVTDVATVTDDGVRMTATLYRPVGATADAPAPGVLAIHGYVNDRETQSPYAIELARRGYVVLAADQRGHGDADPPAFAAGFGGPDAADWLRSLPFVDPEQVVLSGHSMGGWASLIAAGADPDGYASIVISGSSTGTFGAPEGTPEWPRNLGIVFGIYDEFSQLMWGAQTGAQVTATEKMQTLFGSDGPVAADTVYGDVQEGTARWITQPRQTHPANHVTASGVAGVLQWAQQTVPPPQPLDPQDQTWHLKEIGTGLGLLGAFLALFGFSGLLLSSSWFSSLRATPIPAAGASGLGWWFAALIATAVPAISYFWLNGQGPEWLPVSAWFPQQLSNGFAAWAGGNAVIALVLFLLWWALAVRGASFGAVGLRGGILRSVVLAFLTVALVYGLLALVHLTFGSDFRAWVVAMRPPNGEDLRALWGYLPIFAALFTVVGLVLHGQLRSPGSEREGGAVVMNGVLLGAGFAALLLLQYVPLLGGQPLPFGEPLLTIIGMQFLVLLVLAGMLSTWLFRRTGRVWPGAFTNGLFVTCYIVVSQATHFAG